MNAETNAVQGNDSCKTEKNGVAFEGSEDWRAGSSSEVTVAAPRPVTVRTQVSRADARYVAHSGLIVLSACYVS